MVHINVSIHLCHSTLPESFEETSWDADSRRSEENHTSLHSTAGHRVLAHSLGSVALSGSPSSRLSPLSTFVIRIFTGSWADLTHRIWKWVSWAQLPTNLKVQCSSQSLMRTSAEGGWEGPVTGQQPRAPSQGQRVYTANPASSCQGMTKLEVGKLDWFFFPFFFSLA